MNKTDSELYKTSPKSIYLLIGDGEDYYSEPFPKNVEDVYWSHDDALDCNVKYIREDLIPAFHAVPPVLDWTTDLPTVPGLYVLRQYGTLQPIGGDGKENGYEKCSPKLERVILQEFAQTTIDELVLGGYVFGYDHNEFYGPLPNGEEK